MEMESMKEMEEQVERIIGNKKIKVNYVIKRGIPYHEILKYEEEAGADLVVIASHSKSKIEEAFFGSTTEKVVRRSKVSVFVVRD
jgi:nucleotide-binding universal stress UspA family protein